MHLNNPDQIPTLGTNTFVSESAGVVGDVTIGSSSSVLYGAVVRGDVNSISIGSNSTIGLLLLVVVVVVVVGRCYWSLLLIVVPVAVLRHSHNTSMSA